MFRAFMFPWGATAAAVKSEVPVDVNRKEVAGLVIRLQARLGNEKLESYAARASYLWYEREKYIFLLALFVSFIISLFRSLPLYASSPFRPFSL